MLMRARLFHLPELDAQLVRLISATRSSLATDLAIHLISTCLVRDPVVTAADLFNTLDTLAKIARHNSNGSAILLLVEQARQVTRYLHCMLTSSKELDTKGRLYQYTCHS